MGTPFSAAVLTRGAGEREWGTGNGELEEGVVWLARGVNVGKKSISRARAKRAAELRVISMSELSISGSS